MPEPEYRKIRAVRREEDPLAVLRARLEDSRLPVVEPQAPKPKVPFIFRPGFVAACVGTGIWALATNQPKSPTEINPPVPERLVVKNTTLPTVLPPAAPQELPGLERGREVQSSQSTPQKPEGGQSINLREMNFPDRFKLSTDRYRIVKDEDIGVARLLGWIGSLPTKLFFWDLRVGAGLEDKHIKYVVSLLEENENLKDVNVCINHSPVLSDCRRLFTDEKVIARNPFLLRAAVGLPLTFISELVQMFRRGDYYNPYTGTVVLYSGVPAISAHEIGHHQDFHRFESDWWYSLARPFPPVMLYQEWRASDNARQMLLPGERWQFTRYLMPAFATYVLGGLLMAKGVLKKTADRLGCDPGQVTTWQAVRSLATTSAAFYAGLVGAGAAAAAGASSLLVAGAFVGSFAAAAVVGRGIGRLFVPYPYERR